MQRTRLRLRYLALPRRHAGRSQPLANEHARIVEIDDVGRVVELDRGQRERQAAPTEQGGLQALRPEARKLLDDRRDLAIVR